jgi:hypothetical protein
MNSAIRTTVRTAVCLSVFACSVVFAQTSSVKLIKTVDLPGYSGDFDHFAVDYDRNRLLLAAEDHGTMEVFNLKTSTHLRTVHGFGNPHSILVRKGVPTIFVTDSAKQGPTIRDASTYVKKQSVAMTPGSDTAKYDAAANVLYIVTGGPPTLKHSIQIQAQNWVQLPSRITMSKRWLSSMVTPEFF